MSSKKKKEPVIPKPLIKGHTMPIDPALFNSSTFRPQNDLDREFAEDDRMEARDLRTLRVREMKAKREARIRTFENQSGGGTRGSGASKQREEFLMDLRTNPLAKKEWLEMDPASRTVIMSTFNSLAQQGRSSSTLSELFPYMMMTMKQNPNTSVDDMIKIISLGKPAKGDSVVEAIRLGFDMAVKNQPKGTGESVFKETLAFVKPLYDTLSSKDKEIYNQQFKWLQSQIVGPVQQFKDVKELAEMMGMQRGGDNLEFEKVRLEQEKWRIQETWKREDHRDKLDLDRLDNKNKWDAIKTIGTSWVEKAAPIINAGVDAAAKQIRGGPPTTQPGPTQSTTPTTRLVPCTACSTPITVTGSPDSIKCPNPECGITLISQPPP